MLQVFSSMRKQKKRFFCARANGVDPDRTAHKRSPFRVYDFRYTDSNSIPTFCAQTRTTEIARLSRVGVIYICNTRQVCILAHIWGVTSEKALRRICVDWMSRSACASTQSDLGFYCLLTELVNRAEFPNSNKVWWDFHTRQKIRRCTFQCVHFIYDR